MTGLLVRTFIVPVALVLFGQMSDAHGDGDYDGDYGDHGEDGGGSEQGGGELQELKSLSDFDRFLDHSDASIVGAFVAEKFPDPQSKKPQDWDGEEDGEWEAPLIDNPRLESLKSIASSDSKSRFAYTTTGEVLEKLKFKPGQFQAGLYLYRSPQYTSKEHDRARERFPSDNFTQAGVAHWIDTKAQPLVGEFNSNTEHRYAAPVLLIFMDLDRSNNNKTVNYVLKRARKVASSFTGKLAFAVASYSSMSYELAGYGLASMKQSEIRMAVKDAAAKYAAPGDKSFSADSLSAFAKAYLAGELKAYIPEPSKDDSAGADSGADKDEM